MLSLPASPPTLLLLFPVLLTPFELFPRVLDSLSARDEFRVIPSAARLLTGISARISRCDIILQRPGYAAEPAEPSLPTTRLTCLRVARLSVIRVPLPAVSLFLSCYLISFQRFLPPSSSSSRTRTHAFSVSLFPSLSLRYLSISLTSAPLCILAKIACQLRNVIESPGRL